MKTALINPAWTDPVRPDRWGVRAGSRWPHFQRRLPDGSLPRYIPFPFFLAIAAARLQQSGHEVMLIDAVAADMDQEQLLSRLAGFNPGFVFIETSTPSLGNDLALLRRVRQLLPDVFLAGGGAHAPELARGLVQGGDLDAWIAGEYDLVVNDVVDALVQGRDVGAISGVTGKTSGSNSFPATPDVNALPPPLFEQLPMRNYADPVCGLPSPVAASWLSRGCPFGCTFCVWPQLIYGNRTYRPRSIAAALDEVSGLIETYGCESFYFDDDTANIGEGRMIELAAGIRARGLDRYPWAMMARADCMTPTMLAALVDAGLYSIKYGVESIAPCLIHACNKATNLERFHEAIRRTRDAGVKMHLTFTFGIPGETRETIRQTTGFLLETAPESAQFSYCTPFPGTRFHDECRRQGWLLTDDWSAYLGDDHTVIQTPELPAAELEAAVAEVLNTWADFTERRMRAREAGVAAAVTDLARAGEHWTFLGDRERAGFLFVRDDLREAFVPFTEDNTARVVIVSRHDEEKLYRRLLRRDKPRADRAIRLYAMASA
ncbi:MAG: radical SAM protein [Spartobacteria bacterium]|nr:radical SAM protein [Spartobacteria bacterium]